jgi:hypothetical protein
MKHADGRLLTSGIKPNPRAFPLRMQQWFLMRVSYPVTAAEPRGIFTLFRLRYKKAHYRRQGSLSKCRYDAYPIDSDGVNEEKERSGKNKEMAFHVKFR